VFATRAGISNLIGFTANLPTIMKLPAGECVRCRFSPSLAAYLMGRGLWYRPRKPLINQNSLAFSARGAQCVKLYQPDNKLLTERDAPSSAKSRANIFLPENNVNLHVDHSGHRAIGALGPELR
jgi:hypothetical protein